MGNWGIRVFWATFFFTLLMFYQAALARTHPWVSMGMSDIEVISDPMVDYEFRMRLIEGASESIDMVTFDQRSDDLIGLPLLESLERAAARGVRVRYITSWLASMLKDFGNKAGNYMSKITQNYPNAQFIMVGGKSMTNKGWGYIDGFHEKFLIIDHKWVFTTGRGNGEEYLYWLDTGFAIRGPLVAQADEAFNTIWDTAIQENDLASSSGSEQRSCIPEASTKLFSELNSIQVDRLNELMAWAKEPPSGLNEITGRLIHYEFLAALRSLGGNLADHNYESRIGKLSDPILNEVISLLSDAKLCEIAILSPIFPPDLKAALIKRVREGMNAVIFTNSKESHGNAAPVPITVGWYAGLSDLDEVLEAGAHGFALKTGDSNDPYKYLHRKLVVIDDTTFFGSHNLTLASSYTQDEASFEIRSSAFAKKMKLLFQKDLEAYSLPMDPAAIHQDNTSHPFNKWLGSKFKWFYVESD